jgi:IMP dehydrogenase
VKRYERRVRDPITVAPDMTVREVLALTAQHGSPGCRWSKGGKVVGIVTNRDLRFEPTSTSRCANIMTPADGWSPSEGATLEEAMTLLHKFRLERVLVVNDAFELRASSP